MVLVEDTFIWEIEESASKGRWTSGYLVDQESTTVAEKV